MELPALCAWYPNPNVNTWRLVEAPEKLNSSHPRKILFIYTSQKEKKMTTINKLGGLGGGGGVFFGVFVCFFFFRRDLNDFRRQSDK